MGLIQSVIEQSGIPTASVSTLEDVSRKVNPPRVLIRDVTLGYPLGQPGDRDTQRAVIERMLAMTREPVDAPWFDREHRSIHHGRTDKGWFGRGRRRSP